MWLAYAALAAVCFGFRGILYQWTSQKRIDRNLMLLGVYLCGAAVAAIASLVLGQSWSRAVWTGTMMGCFSFVSNAAMYKGFAVGKASLVAVFTALTPVVVALVSYFRWGELLNVRQAAAFLVIIAGIVIIRYSSDLSWRNLQGVEWALLAMVAFGITDLSSKQAMLWRADKLPTLFVMYMTGSVLFLALWSRMKLREQAGAKALRREAAVGVATALQSAASLPADAQAWAAAKGEPSAGCEQAELQTRTATLVTQFVPAQDRIAAAGPEQARPQARLEPMAARSRSVPAQMPDAEKDGLGRSTDAPVSPAPVTWSMRRTLGWGALVGLTNISGMIFILPAFQHGVTGLVSAVVATNVLLILLYVRLFLHERWSVQQMIGIACALAGVLGLRLLE